MKPALIFFYLVAGVGFAGASWPTRCNASEVWWHDAFILPVVVMAWPVALAGRIGVAAYDPILAMRPLGCGRR